MKIKDVENAILGHMEEDPHMNEIIIAINDTEYDELRLDAIDIMTPYGDDIEVPGMRDMETMQINTLGCTAIIIKLEECD